MEHYYYHGIEAYKGSCAETLEIVNRILDEGLLTRSKVGGYEDEKMDHVCLYRKNEEFDYDAPLAFLKSAKGGWIDNGFVIVVNPDIEARQATAEETDLPDEWRCYSSIPPEKFAGIGLPLDFISQEIEDKSYTTEERKEIQRMLNVVCKKAIALGLFIENSDDKEFTEKLDGALSSEKGQGQK